MTLNCKDYINGLKDIHALSKKKTPKELIEFVSTLAIATGIPIIVVCYYILSLYGPNTALEDKVEFLIKFYGVKEVLNKEVGKNVIP